MLTVYVWLSGHRHNVGDSALRRAYADALRQNARLRVWSSAPRSGYETGLGLRANEAAPSFRHWYWNLLLDAFRGRSAFAFNAGEFGVTKAYFAGMLCLLPVAGLIRLRRRPVLWIGAAVTTRRRWFTWPFDLFLRLCSLVYWRDSQSNSLMGRGDSMPDWAFALRAASRSTSAVSDQVPLQRRFVAVSLRGDRPYPTAEWINAVAGLAGRLRCEVIAVAQVAEDDAYCRRLADDLKGTAAPWQHERHDLQEQLARDAYANSVVTISDRLHVLIMAATEGSIPLGWTEQARHKIAIHFDEVDATWVAPPSSSTVIEALETIEQSSIAHLQGSTEDVVRKARARLADVSDQLERLT